MSLAVNKRYIEEDTRFTGKYSKQVFETIWFAFKPLLGKVSILLAIGVAARFALLSTASIMGYWADSFCKPPQECQALPQFLRSFDNSDYVSLLLFVTGIGFVLNGFFRVFISRLSCLAASSLYDEVTFRTSRLPMSFFDSTPVGRIISRFSSDYGNIFRMLGGPIGEFLCILFDLIIMVVLTSFASPYYIPFLVVTVLMNYGVYKLNLNRLRTQRRNLSLMRAPSIAHFSETIQGYRAIKVFGRETSFGQRFGEFVDRYLTERMRTIVVMTFFAWQMTSMTLVLLFATGVAGVYLVSSGMASVGSIAVAFTFVTMASTSVQQFFEFVANLEEALTGIERLNEYLRKDLENGGRLPSTAVFPTQHAWESAVEQTNRATFLNRNSASIEVKGLSLRYRAHLPRVLDDVSFSVKAGQRIGIIGHTGAGKSSLIQALFHLYPLESGDVCIGGFTAELSKDTQMAPSEHKVDLETFRKAIGFIPQEPVLFKSTLRENLTLDRNVTDDELLLVLKSVGLENWLFNMKENPLNYAIEERGANLSAGQRQLVCMARCVLQNNPIVLMDEATSAIDPETEKQLVATLETTLKAKTQIIVAHRLSTIESCDEIVWLHRGKLRMKGRPQDVLKEFV